MAILTPRGENAVTSGSLTSSIRELPEKWLKWAARCGLAGFFLGMISPLTVADLDMWHEMALFRASLAIGWVPDYDLFAYTPTVFPSIHHEWGMGAILYLLTVSAGLGAAGLMVLKYLLTALIAAGCFLCARRNGGSDSSCVFLGILGVCLAFIGFTTIRAQVFTLLFLTVLLLLLQEDARGKKWWIAVWIPLYVAWLNIHAGFLVGAGVFFLYTIEKIALDIAQGQSPAGALRRSWYLIATGLAMIPLAGVNPYGYLYIPYLYRAVMLKRPLIPEWQPLWKTGVEFIPAYALSIAVVVYAFCKRGMRYLRGLAILLAAAWLALWHVRHLSIYGLVWICCVPGFIDKTPLADLLERMHFKFRRPLLVFWLALAVFGLASGVHYRCWRLHLPTTAAEHKKGFPVIYPAGVVKYLADHHFRGNLMTPFDTGAFVSWKLYPEVKVSMDSRYEVAYPPGALSENVKFYGAKPGWQKVLDRYPATDAILVPRWSPLEKKLPDDEGPKRWVQIYQDDGYSLFVRASLAKRFPIVDRRGRTIEARFP